MARTLNRLSARFVATVSLAGRYADGGNLYLSVSPNGGRRWVFMFRHGGRVREMGLGSARDVTLARAREKATDARAHLTEGRNPLDVRPAAQATIPTFGQAAEDHIASMEKGWRGRTSGGWRWTLSEYVAPIRDRPVDQITTEDVLGVLKPIWTTKPETAVRVRARMEAVLDACKARGQRTGENPCRWRGHLSMLLPPAKKLSRGHHAAMPFREVPEFVEKLHVSPTTSNLALELLILTAARSGEVMGATWGEISLDDKLWTVPANRMKAKREHRVPLTPRAIEILTNVRPEKPDPGTLVFTGARPGRPTASNRSEDRPLSVMALTMALRRAGGGDFTVHGMRSSFRDWCGDATAFPRELAEAALAHVIRDDTERAYRRGDGLEKRRKLMDAWGSFLDGRKRGNVLAFAGARS